MHTTITLNLLTNPGGKRLSSGMIMLVGVARSVPGAPAAPGARVASLAFRGVLRLVPPAPRVACARSLGPVRADGIFGGGRPNLGRVQGRKKKYRIGKSFPIEETLPDSATVPCS